MLQNLIPNGIRPPTIFAVKYDPESQWLTLSTTIAAGYLLKGFHVLYATGARPREVVRTDLERLGVDVPTTEEAGLLRIDDWYSASLRQDVKSDHRPILVYKTYSAFPSLKISDLSIAFQQFMKGGGSGEPEDHWPAASLLIWDSLSPMLRFNDEKVFLEWVESRFYPFERASKRIELLGYAFGVHGESFYRRIEDASDGVVEIRVLERGDELKNVLRVRSLKGQPHDNRWHEIEIKPNGEAILTS